VFVCVLLKKRERKTEKVRDSERQREREVYGCVSVFTREREIVKDRGREVHE
jgi:hypothetical protein